MELIVADEAGGDLMALSDFALSMDAGWGDSVGNDFELQCSAGLPSAAWRVYADGTAIGGRVESYSLQTSRTGRILKWKGSSWAGVLEKRLLWPDAGSDHLTYSGDAASMISWAVARLGLEPLFGTPAASCGTDVSLTCSRDEPDAWTNLRLALRAAGMRMGATWSHGRCALAAEPVADWRDRVDTDLVDFDLDATLLCENHLLIAGEGELADRATADLYADAAGKVSQVRSLSGVMQVDYFYDSSATKAEDLVEKGTEKLSDLQTHGAIEVDVRDGWEPGLGDLVTGHARDYGVSVTAEVCGWSASADGSGCKVTYYADGDGAVVTSG